jgi:hypothetical protein
MSDDPIQVPQPPPVEKTDAVRENLERKLGKGR